MEKKSISLGKITRKYWLLSVLLLLPVFSFSQHLNSPPRTLPSVVILNGFKMHVVRWANAEWDPQRQIIINASGIAWTSWRCGENSAFNIVNPYLTVAGRVADPLKEISKSDARLIQNSAAIGTTIQLDLENMYAVSREYSRLVQEWLSQSNGHRGEFLVSFTNATLRPGAVSGTADMIAGAATFPAARTRIPVLLEYSISGFKLIIRSMSITQDGVLVDAELEFPTSIVDPGSGRPAHISLSNVTIDSRCEFYSILNSESFGPWAIGNTGILIKGTGMIVDFSTGWQTPELPLPTDWRGVILKNGETVVMSSGTPVSNTGYLQGPYAFSNALIVSGGFEGQLTQTHEFSYGLLQPFGYKVMFNSAVLNLNNSRVQSGLLGRGRLFLPEQAVSDQSDHYITVPFTNLQVNSGLDLNGHVVFGGELAWGHLYTNNRLKAYIGRDSAWGGQFYTAGTYRPPFWPADSTGQSSPPLGMGEAAEIVFIESNGVQGLTLFNIKELQINTLDTPDKKPLLFQLQATKSIENWLNVSSLGVHAKFSNLSATISNQNPLLLGPIYQPYYVGSTAFQPDQRAIYTLKIGFMSSAVVYSDMSGGVKLDAGVIATINYEGMNFTSTAHNVAGKVVLNSPITLDHWGLQVVPRPGTSTAGVISVKTGQILFTAAGLQEKRHFDEPFYLNWGEMLADGNIGRLFFDYHMPGQKFDGFPYVASVVKLSAYNPTNPNDDAYLQTGGTAHFDLFGAQYLNIQDKKCRVAPAGLLSCDPSPYNGRVIDLNGSADPPARLLPTNFKLRGNWSDALSDIDFTIQYDDYDQDGFIGKGTMGILGIDGKLASSINMTRTLICMSIHDAPIHDINIGPVANFGLVSRINGCVCVQEGGINKAFFRADLEGAANVAVVLRAASNGYLEITLTPSITEYVAGGDMYINFLSFGDIQVNGRARFTIGRSSPYLDGDVEGSFNSASTLGFNSLSADGRVNWHLEPDNHSLQGRLSVSVVYAGMGIGVEGGLYIGRNAPRAQAWILYGLNDKFRLDIDTLPDRLTGIYGYVRYTRSITSWLVSGGFDAYVGLGAFSITGASRDPLLPPCGIDNPCFPNVVGFLNVKIWGEILGGLVSASAQGMWEVHTPYSFYYRGGVSLSGCVLYTVCGSVTVTCELNDREGFRFY